MDAVADRDLFIEFASACALFGVHISRIAEDLIIWSSSEFRLVTLPDEFCTGSSLMPQKRNPDSCELLRGKAARLQGNLQTLLSLVKGLPMAYNRDLQEDKPPVFDSFDQAAICADVLEGTVRGMTFNRDRCAAAASDPALLATDLADYLVSRGVPFREAHHAVGAVVALAERKGCAIPELSNIEVNRLHPRFGTRWASVFNLSRALMKRKGTGMPSPSQIARQFSRWRKILR
jgi:argininosuccinate lyase